MRNLASFSQLIIFAKIAEAGNLSKAALELNITPSAVSKSLSLFEKRMGVLLVKRTSRNTSLTEQGQIFFEKISNILGSMERALTELETFKSYPKGILRVTCPFALGSIQLMPLVSKYMDRYPDVDVHMTLDDRKVKLDEENFDLALRISTTTFETYVARKLALIKWIYCASPEYIEKYGSPASIEEILESGHHRYLAYPRLDSCSAWVPDHENKQSHTVKVQGSSDCTSSVALMVAAINGTGIACLPTYIASTAVLDGKLKLLAFENHPATDQTLYAMYFQSRHTNPMIRTFIDFLVEHIFPIPPWDRSLCSETIVPLISDTATS